EAPASAPEPEPLPAIAPEGEADETIAAPAEPAPTEEQVVAAPEPEPAEELIEITELELPASDPAASVDEDEAGGTIDADLDGLSGDGAAETTPSIEPAPESDAAAGDGDDTTLSATTGGTTAAGSGGEASGEACETAAADETDVTGAAPEGADLPSCDPAAVPGSGPSPPGAQVIHLDLDGAEGVDYHGPVSVTGIDVPAFAAPGALAGQEQAIAAALRDEVEALLAGQDVVVTLERPASGDYSTIYVGGTYAAFAGHGPLFAVSEKVDAGNADRNDIALVFSASIPTKGKTVEAYAQELAAYVAHEAGHLLGFEHMRTVHTHAEGDTFGEVAFKPYTHVEVAKDVRNDLIEDGDLDIVGYREDGTTFVTSYGVHPLVVEAITRFPGHYYAGTVGPDGFPDLTFGQRIIHPSDTGTWLARIFDMAWAAQSEASFTRDEKLQILSFAYGYATHAAGDFFAHTLVNEFAEGVFPAVFDIVAGETRERDAANAIRHLLLEAYIGDATPGFDGNGDRSLLPNGDLSDDATPGIAFDAPMRYIYDALVAPFPGDPTSPADSGTGRKVNVDAATKSFTLDATDTGPTFAQHNFRPGMQFFTFGFAQAANNGKFTIASVSLDGRTIVVDQTVADETGDGDEALVVRGDRGPLLDAFYIIQRYVDDTLLALGGAPAQTLDQLLADIVPLLTDGDPGTNPDALTTNALV
ncbi:MAG TPA: zinc dependent phospholipase C family protein, partial [Actinomycetota bacterium]